MIPTEHLSYVHSNVDKFKHFKFCIKKKIDFSIYFAITSNKYPMDHESLSMNKISIKVKLPTISRYPVTQKKQGVVEVIFLSKETSGLLSGRDINRMNKFAYLNT